LPVWLVVFPEGTRYTPDKNPGAIERARAFAEKKGYRKNLGDFL
jgi:hypothetical protein